MLAAPVNNRLFFAGEACSQHDYSTAHGAFLTGVAAAMLYQPFDSHCDVQLPQYRAELRAGARTREFITTHGTATPMRSFAAAATLICPHESSPIDCSR
jgi:hypothetical protein